VGATGTFTISLNFELFWGVRDRLSASACAGNILGARDAIPRMLDLFDRYGVHGTWATVGLLFFDRKADLMDSLPELRPQYADPTLSPYPGIGQLGPNERQDPYHFGLSLIQRIRACPGQEIGTHTFSHYYCLEEGQTPDTFRADLEAATRSAARLGIALRSLVFPRNQFSQAYLSICRDAGIEAVRGNQSAWLFRSEGEAKESLIKKACRRLDHYLPLTGHNGVTPERDRLGISNIRSSRFLLPMPTRTRIFGQLCQRRIEAAMRHAAGTDQVFHLWWHPHNFGSHVDDNLAILRTVMERYRALSEEQGMVSRNMGEIATAARPGTTRQLDGFAQGQVPSKPLREAVEAARVSATAPSHSGQVNPAQADSGGSNSWCGRRP
jgi:peptidoglycan/xylan/chitin deacetylase (PgdA/CDA1 family)